MPVLYLLIIMITLCAISCTNKVSMQNYETSLPKNSPTQTPVPQGSTSLEGNAKELFHEALKLKGEGKYEKAIGEMKKVIELEQDNLVAYKYVAEWYFDLKDFESSAEYQRKIIEKKSDDPIPHWSLAKILVYNLKRYDEGIKEAKIAKELYGKNATSYVPDQLIGEAYDGLGDYESAIKYYKSFLKGAAGTPESNDYKKVKQRIEELKQMTK